MVNKEDIAINIFHEEEDFLIINKSPGLVMHPGAGCHDGTLANALAFHFPALKQLPRCGIVHRLDKDTSGAFIIAKNRYNKHKYKPISTKESLSKLVLSILDILSIAESIISGI